MTFDAGAPVKVSADVVVVSIDDAVLLMVSGQRTPENVALVDEVRSTLVGTGTAPDAIDVLWA